MKKLVLTLAVVLGTLASFAQAPLDVTNASSNPIMIKAAIVDANCQVSSVGTFGPVAPGGTITLPAGNPGDEWFGLHVNDLPTGGLTAPNTVSTFNKCLITCSTGNDFPNGLNAIWDPTCSSVRIF